MYGSRRRRARRGRSRARPVLSRHALPEPAGDALGGRPPVLLAWTAERGYAAAWEYTNLQLRGADGARIPQATIHLRRTRFVAGRLYERLRIRN